MIDRQHPRDLYDLFRFGKAALAHESELMRKVAVLFSSTMDRGENWREQLFTWAPLFLLTSLPLSFTTATLMSPAHP